MIVVATCHMPHVTYPVRDTALHEVDATVKRTQEFEARMNVRLAEAKRHEVGNSYHYILISDDTP